MIGRKDRPSCKISSPNRLTGKSDKSAVEIGTITADAGSNELIEVVSQRDRDGRWSIKNGVSAAEPRSEAYAKGRHGGLAPPPMAAS